MNANFVTASLHREVLTRRTIPVSTRFDHEKIVNKKEVSRLITAAVINKGFRNLLLSDPLQAIQEGFQGETFHLKDVERDIILSINAKSLADFAQQLLAYYVNENGNGYHQTNNRKF